ncbi:glycerol-3-phosphate dehydrogenase/oxidase [Algisphaera agarilytica]|uniref:Glycerol-3-phosphate dehydrogenase n=1 Tax=Algisphaera agarilytica TaxID=1385975 RepID=A0A7X0H709_9BACT|nr:glycerol-3-phosphate dehydrogenase/oxidase [Algisphaera agarilytica]MBB6430451.1 glycerol-3-phosphate dehydrogenase [Algisphaera agarilytica]
MTQDAIDNPTPDPATAMSRDLSRLDGQTFDVLVVGAGVYGAWVALDAAQRGLTVALVDRADFGAATSANSQRILHGGFRYLQHADFKRMRESIRERSIVMRLMPHLVESQSFLVPTTPGGVQRKSLMRVALKMNDIVSCDRNKGLPESKHLGHGQIISKEECLAQAPGLDPDDVTGGAIFHDGQIVNSERLTLAVVQTAAAEGAVVANHVEVNKFLRDDSTRVLGVEATDKLTGQTVKIHADLTISCTGPWTANTLDAAGMRIAGETCDKPVKKPYDIFRAVVLVTRNVLNGSAVAVKGRAAYQDKHEVVGKGYRNFFVTPWHDLSLIGTYYEPYSGDPADVSISEDEVRKYVDEFNATYPTAKLGYDEVKWSYVGCLPLAEGAPPDDPQYQKHYSILEHESQNGTPGLLSILGVKWTTARDVAEKTVDRAVDVLARSVAKGKTADAPLAGGAYEDYDGFMAEASASRPDNVPEETLKHFLKHYGDAYAQLLALIAEEPGLVEPLGPTSPVTGAEIVYAAQSEMAVTLADAVFGRTTLGFFGWPGDAVLRRAAELMARSTGWDDARQNEQIESVRAVYAMRGVAYDARPVQAEPAPTSHEVPA